MPAAAIAGGVALVGGAMASSSAKSAARAQQQAADAATAEQRRQYDLTRQDYAPFRETGVAANNRLAYLLGIGGTSNGAPQSNLSRDQIRNELIGQFTTSGGSGNLRTDHDSSYVNNRARLLNQRNSQPVIDEAGLNAAIERRYAQQQAALAAQNSATQAAQNDPAYGSLLRDFSYDDLNNDVVYNTGIDFALDQGQQGINRQAAASGNMLSGATLKALTRFGAQTGNQYAGDAYNRFNTNKTNTYNRLAGVAGSGQTATNQVASAGQNMANNVSNNLIGAGNARGASGVAQGNAWSNAIGGAFNNYQQNQSMGGYGDNNYGYNVDGAASGQF